MDLPFPVRGVEEGAAHLLVPDVPHRKGPGTAGPWPFYNPTMTVNRDIAAIVLAKWPHRLRSVLDGLAATGAWGIRMTLEADLKVSFNDRSILAADLIRENLHRNRISADVASGDLVSLLHSNRYDFVDIDPFGPPTPFLASVLEHSQRGSGIGVTATDTSVLGGTYPAACLRRYNARSLRCAQGPEIGLRILLGFCERLAAEQGKSIRPILSFAAEHFFRTYVTLGSRSGGSHLACVKRLTGGEFVPCSEGDANAIGPLWMGPLHDAPFVRRLTPSDWTTPQAARLLSTIQREADLPPFFVTTDELAARERGSPPKLERFLEAIRESGHRAERTHFHLRGVRTDAPFDVVLSVFREQMPSGSTGGSGPAS